jgi:hypothetical protein
VFPAVDAQGFARALPSSRSGMLAEVSSTTPKVCRGDSSTGTSRPGRGMSGLADCRREGRA